jgi:alkanesulfonate monooxygenase SsuD/methylene tetrahydromethanopterin reductase-like flavin-dependent oxidoreductase (luciferase family)
MTFELGVLTSGGIPGDVGTGRLPSAQQRMRDTVEQAVLAEQVGLDVFGVGEHHRGGSVTSSPAAVLSAIAARTSSIRLTSAVTVLSSLDPVRVFQDFATLDLVSGGRAEIIAGRGSFLDSFPLFGLYLEDHAALFAEKLDLLVTLREEDPITWMGRFRTPLHEADVAPRPVQERLPVYVGVGSDPSSAALAGRMGLPLALGLRRGRIDSAVGVHEAHVQAARDAGHDPAALRRTITAHGFVSGTGQQARATTHAHVAHGMQVPGRPGASGIATGRSSVDGRAPVAGALVVGSPQQVVDEVAHQHELYGHDRLLLDLGPGGVPQREVLAAVELLGTEVAPVLRREIPVLQRLGV